MQETWMMACPVCGAEDDEGLNHHRLSLLAHLSNSHGWWKHPGSPCPICAWASVPKSYTTHNEQEKEHLESHAPSEIAKSLALHAMGRDG